MRVLKKKSPPGDSITSASPLTDQLPKPIHGQLFKKGKVDVLAMRAGQDRFFLLDHPTCTMMVFWIRRAIAGSAFFEPKELDDLCQKLDLVIDYANVKPKIFSFNRIAADGNLSALVSCARKALSLYPVMRESLVLHDSSGNPLSKNQIRYLESASEPARSQKEEVWESINSLVNADPHLSDEALGEKLAFLHPGNNFSLASVKRHLTWAYKQYPELKELRKKN
jgi:hypothetical protein